MKNILLALLLLCASVSPAAAQSPIMEERTQEALQKGYDEPQEDNLFYSELMNVVFVLILIIFIMIVAAYYMRKFMQNRVEQVNVTSSIKVLEQRNLSAKSVLYIVEAEGKRVLVGESVSGVVGLAELSSKSFQDVYEQQ